MMDEEEIVRTLVDRGVPEAAARRTAQEEMRRRGQVLVASKMPPAPAERTAPYTTAAAESWVWPVRLLLPWSHLCSDDKHYTATIVTLEGGRQVAKIVRTQEYRDALTAVRKLVVPKVPSEPVAFPLALVARVWVPDNRIHDVPNFGKNCHDALEHVVYANDRWLYSAHWLRAGVDVDAPRAEVTISPFPT